MVIINELIPVIRKTTIASIEEEVANSKIIINMDIKIIEIFANFIYSISNISLFVF